MKPLEFPRLLLSIYFYKLIYCCLYPCSGVHVMILYGKIYTSKMTIEKVASSLEFYEKYLEFSENLLEFSENFA